MGSGVIEEGRGRVTSAGPVPACGFGDWSPGVFGLYHVILALQIICGVGGNGWKCDAMAFGRSQDLRGADDKSGLPNWTTRYLIVVLMLLL